MKILVTGDWHADAYTAGIRRFEDISNAAKLTAAAASGCDLYVFLGDLTDPEVGAFWANSLAIQIAQQLSHDASCASRWLVGNHDVVEDSYGTHAMLPLAAYIRVIDQPKVELMNPGSGTNKAALVFFPYTSTSRSYDPEAFARQAFEQCKGWDRVLVFSHLMIEGITPGSETTDMARGRDVFLPIQTLHDLFGDRLTIFNGHYHQSQTFAFPLVDGGARPVHIPGSLVRLTKGEIGNVPGYLVVNV